MLSISNLCFKYGKLDVLNKISFTIPNSSIALLTGKNGSGKTTLLRILSGLLKADSGDIFFLHKKKKIQFPALSKMIGTIFYNVEDQFVCSTIEDELRFTLDNSIAEDKQSFDDIVNYFKVQHLLDMRPDELSAGEKQMILIAITVSLNRSILLLDEPFANLDAIESRKNYKMLQNLVYSENKLLVISTNYNYSFITPDISISLD